MTPAYRNALVILLAIALVVRLAAGWAWQSRLDGRFGFGDSEGYWALGLAIAEGRPYEYGSEHARVFRTPGYPILLAPILRFAGDGQLAVLLARAESALLGVLAVAGVCWLAGLLFDRRAALVAAALTAFYPGAIALGSLILSEAPFCPLMLLNLCLWIVAWQSQSKGRTALLAIAAGLAAGAATLMRPSWLLFAPLAAAAAIVLKPPQLSTSCSGSALSRYRWRQVWIGACLTTGLATAMLPWWIRNACVTGRFVPTTLQVGASLYDGLNPHATGASNMDFVTQFVAQQRRDAVAPTADDSFELPLDRRLRSEAIAWAWANPGRAAELAGVKFLRTWNVWPNEPRLSGRLIRGVVFFTYTPLLFFAIIGAWRTLDRGWPYILCWLPAVYFTLLHMVFIGSIRYREPAMLALLALAAGGMEAGIRDWGLRTGIRDWGLRTGIRD